MLKAEDGFTNHEESNLTRPVTPSEERDDGLRRLLIWTFAALVFAAVAAAAIAQLAIRVFDTP